MTMLQDAHYEYKIAQIWQKETITTHHAVL